MKSVQQIINLCETPIYKKFVTLVKTIDQNHMEGRKTTAAQLVKYDTAKENWYSLIRVAGQLKTAINL